MKQFFPSKIAEFFKGRRQTQFQQLLACLVICLLPFVLTAQSTSTTGSEVAATPFILQPTIMRRDVQYFGSLDKEDVKNYVLNADTYDWLSKEIPLFECPDSILQQMYYFRWWSFRKHLVKTPLGFVFTEFITPVKFAGAYNTISSALGHQVYEGRWLQDPKFIQQYVHYWLYGDAVQKKPGFHRFSSWVDDAVYQLYLVNQDKAFIQKILPALQQDYRLWEKERGLPGGLFWQYDVRDAMEESISGSRHQKNIRPTINSYMFGNARALAKMNLLLDQKDTAIYFEKKAEALRKLVLDSLWNDSAKFFEVRYPNGKFANAREAIGFIPWYFQLPRDNKEEVSAWNQLIDTAGFQAPWGLTTAERRHPLFRTHGSGHGCEWDGAIWPYATTQTLKALSHLLNNYRHHGKMDATVFYNALQKYAWAQQKDGHPFIGEYQDERTGKWLRGDPRSRYYNHSGFADLIISDLVGLKPHADNTLEIRPLIPAGKWDWFCLDKVRYHGHQLTIVWDKHGTKYRHGKGFQAFVDGRLVAHSKVLKALKAKL
ncbi:MAG TPA: glycosyl hydrolase family 65 protein [Arachidicoccus sp.]|nr:glycosyl hydrolase family 65 protein [Arachidicoccus sp.]